MFQQGLSPNQAWSMRSLGALSRNSRAQPPVAAPPAAVPATPAGVQQVMQQKAQQNFPAQTPTMQFSAPKIAECGKSHMNASGGTVSQAPVKARELPWSVFGSEAWPKQHKQAFVTTFRKLSSFSQGFFEKCFEEGYNSEQVRELIQKTASIDPTLSDELAKDFEKLAFIGPAMRALPAVAKAIPSAFGQAARGGLGAGMTRLGRAAAVGGANPALRAASQASRTSHVMGRAYGPGLTGSRLPLQSLTPAWNSIPATPQFLNTPAGHVNDVLGNIPNVAAALPGHYGPGRVATQQLWDSIPQAGWLDRARNAVGAFGRGAPQATAGTPPAGWMDRAGRFFQGQDIATGAELPGLGNRLLRGGLGAASGALAGSDLGMLGDAANIANGGDPTSSGRYTGLGALGGAAIGASQAIPGIGRFTRPLMKRLNSPTVMGLMAAPLAAGAGYVRGAGAVGNQVADVASNMGLSPEDTASLLRDPSQAKGLMANQVNKGMMDMAQQMGVSPETAAQIMQNPAQAKQLLQNEFSPFKNFDMSLQNLPLLSELPGWSSMSPGARMMTVLGLLGGGAGFLGGNNTLGGLGLGAAALPLLMQYFQGQTGGAGAAPSGLPPGAPPPSDSAGLSPPPGAPTPGEVPLPPGAPTGGPPRPPGAPDMAFQSGMLS